MSFEERSDALVELLDELSEQEQPFVLVGGHAVSPFNARFSTDLVVAKLHSARATELRDVVAIATEIELENVTPHLRRGDEEALCEQLERGLEILDGDEFEHGFQSDFGTTEVQTDTIEGLRSYLGERIAELE